jgi:hypothetical protein
MYIGLMNAIFNPLQAVLHTYTQSVDILPDEYCCIALGGQYNCLSIEYPLVPPAVMDA